MATIPPGSAKVDVRETIPCVVESLVAGRGAAHLAAMKSEATVPQEGKTNSILKPQVKDRGEHWLGEGRQDIAPFDMRTFNGRRMRSDDIVCRIRYVADAADEMWVAKMAPSFVAATRGAGGKQGPVGSNTSKNPRALSLSFLEDVFTALEVQAVQHPEVAIERISLDAAKFFGELDLPLTQSVEDIRLYWISRRKASGGMPLITQLTPQPSEENAHALCATDVLGDCPLPFLFREGVMYASELATEEGTSPDGKRRRREQRMDEFLSSAGTLVAAVLEREQARLALAQQTVYELAALRRHGRGRVEANSIHLHTSTISDLVSR